MAVVVSFLGKSPLSDEPEVGPILPDQLSALKCLVSGRWIAFVVLKATSRKLIGPKRKHLNCK